MAGQSFGAEKPVNIGGRRGAEMAVRPAANWVPREIPEPPSPPTLKLPNSVASRNAALEERPPAAAPAIPLPPSEMPHGSAPSIAPLPTPAAPQADAAPLPAADAAYGALTLAEIEQMALSNNPTLVQAAMRVRAAEGGLVQAGLYPNPKLAYVGEEIGDEGRAGQQGARLSQEVVTGRKLAYRAAVQSRAVEQAQYACQMQRLRVINDVRTAWYDTLIAARSVALHEELVKIGQQGAKAADDLFAAKEVGRVDVLQARIEADSARLQWTTARNRHQAAWRRLAAVVGLPEMAPTPLAGDLQHAPAELSWDDALGRLLQESPELCEAYAGVQRARNEVASQYAERIPNVDLAGGVRYNHASNSTVATVEAGLALPLFNRNQGNILRAQAELAAAEREVQRVELWLRQRLAAAFEEYANAKEQTAQYAAQILPNAKASLDLVIAGYRQGEFDYLKLLTAQRTYFQANLEYLESLRKYRTSVVAMEGLLLSGGLDRNEQNR
jgi:cobalt-zinc-cadmium efflux system outer membrane protein